MMSRDANWAGKTIMKHPKREGSGFSRGKGGDSSSDRAHEGVSEQVAKFPFSAWVVITYMFAFINSNIYLCGFLYQCFLSI